MVVVGVNKEDADDAMRRCCVKEKAELVVVLVAASMVAVVLSRFVSLLVVAIPRFSLLGTLRTLLLLLVASTWVVAASDAAAM